MIDSEKVAEIKRLLAEGRLSQRKIAARARVSRGTVGAIAAGRRPDYEELRKRRAEEEVISAGPVERCPSCGGTVHLPCRLCHVRSLLARSKLSPQPRRPEEIPRVELAGEYRRRYEQLRARRFRGEPQESSV
jgi:transcriptional regulator with XRE-family HTH domain